MALQDTNDAFFSSKRGQIHFTEEKRIAMIVDRAAVSAL